MSDILLDLAKNKFFKSSLKKIGLRLPTPIRRDNLPYREQMFRGEKYAVLVGEKLKASLNRFFTEEKIITTSMGVYKDNLSNYEVLNYDDRLSALIFDASEGELESTLNRMYKFFNLYISMLSSLSRVIIFVSDREPILKAAVLGFAKSLQKELGAKGATVNLISLEAENINIDMSLRYLLSRKSSYITGQTFKHEIEADLEKPGCINSFKGKNCVVTGASRGIGLAICRSLVKAGATVTGVDLDQVKQQLERRMKSIGASSYVMDISDRSSYGSLKKYLDDLGGVDVFIHNAGITRDGVFKNLSFNKWNSVLDINLYSIMELNKTLEPSFNEDAKLIMLSSIAGLAGNFGQTNYAASKSAVASYTAEYSKSFKGSVNAIAPGFIETKMTENLPFMLKFLARRMNSLNQAGRPEDVAELCLFLAMQNSLTGQVIRCCGGNVMG